MRKKKSLSVKESTPVKLPHDGPLYQLWPDKKGPTAAWLLLAASQQDATGSSCHDDDDSRMLQLVTTLQQATQIQQQLQALHQFKNWYLQQKGKATVDVTYLYRILLEWMLSAQTVTTLRRTLQSLLKVLSSDAATNKQRTAVLWSLLEDNNNCCWSQPLTSLREALHGMPQEWCNCPLLLQATVEYLAQKAAALRPQIATTTANSATDGLTWNGTYHHSNDMRQALELAHVLKAVLRLSSGNDETVVVGTTNQRILLQDFLWTLLACRAVPVDDLSTVAIAYGYVRNVGTSSSSRFRDKTTTLNATVWLEHEKAKDLSELSRAVLWQGLAVTASVEQLLAVDDDQGGSRMLLLQVFWSSFEQLALESPNPEVRLVALKGIRTLVSRCQTIENYEPYRDLFADLAQKTLDVVMRCWEKPPTRKLASAISSLFQSLVAQWMPTLEQKQQDLTTVLVDQLLAQPPNRKGRYVALEILLPLMGARKMLRDGCLLEELLRGIGEHGHNTKTIADLWAKLLQTLLQETLAVEKTKSEVTAVNDAGGLPLAWLGFWVPSLAQSVLSTELSRRKQLAAFCLPRIVDVVGGVATRVSQAFAALFVELQENCKRLGILDEAYSRERETTMDRILWAKLEVVRISTNLACFRSTHEADLELRSAVRAAIPMDLLCNALTHPAPSIRIAALQAMDKIVVIHQEEATDSLDSVKQEARLWKYMLPYSVKTEGNEYIVSVLECLVSFLDRMIRVEVSRAPDTTPGYLKVTHEFIVDFLLGDLLLFLGYPGTAASKETFLLSMLEYIAVFAVRDSVSGMDCRLLPKTLLQRRRSDVEVATVDRVLVELMGPEVFACLYTALNSIWDAQRETAYRLCSSLLTLAHEASLPLLPDFTPGEARTSLIERGVELASSPRPREADTGSRLLAILCHSLPHDEEKVSYISFLLRLLEERLEATKKQLCTIMTDSVELSTVQDFPLSHGLVHSLRLVADNDRIFLKNEMNSQVEALLHRMAGVTTQAVQLSLSVVADVRDGDTFGGFGSDALYMDSKTRIRAKINPGMIGANGIFSRLVSVSEDEVRRNLASQSLVMGTWLLTKETCAAMAAILAIKGYRADPSLVERTGMLLISTLTTLKHTGAAFAAHRALQAIAQRCQDMTESNLQHLPTKWAKRLMTEVAERDIVRNSTLRRSTGYALGFLSLMRSEVSSGVSRFPLCFHIMSSLVRLALPPQGQMESFLTETGLGNESMTGHVFSTGGRAWLDLVADSDYELRCRIHALNILRVIVLDSPLSKEVFPFIGDAITCSIVGYTDPEWAVRNSSTMVFAAVMLRAVDADKNASNAGITSRNATSVTELFRSYPALPQFLLSVMRASLDGRLANGVLSPPPVLPILLLLARLQPVCQTGTDAVSLAEPFVAVTIRCLGDREISIRKAGARALTNLSSREEGSDTSVGKLAAIFEARIAACVQACAKRSLYNWNEFHGTLLTLHEMLNSSDEGKEAVHRILSETGLADLSLIEGRNPTMPPSCLLTLIGIYCDLDLPCALRKCNEIVGWCEWLTSRKLHVAGVGELATMAADLAANAINAKLWKASTSSTLQSFLVELGNLFQSSSLDIRVAAVKRFKKAIYGGLDSVVERSTSQPEFVCELLMSVTELLAKVFSLEVHIGDNSSSDTRAHPPTLRRLSRCLLECLDASDRLGLLAAKSVSGIQNKSENTSRLFRRQLKDVVDPDSTTLLLGNIVELQPYSGSRNCSTEQSRGEFLALVARISDPSCHWRLRHSAACALAASYKLSNGGSTQASKSVHKLHPDSVAAWIKLVQDADIDVRFAASRVWVSDPMAPEMALCRFFAAQACVPALSKAEFSLKTALELSLDFKTSEGCRNAKTIFREEHPNAYEERSLVFQCAIVAATSPREGVLPNSCPMIADQLMSRCQDALSTLLQEVHRCSGSSFLLNKTRMVGVFVALHSLLVGCSLALRLTAHRDAASVRKLAGKLLSAATDLQFHPSILHSLDALSKSDLHSGASRDIERSCFLSTALVQDHPSYRGPMHATTA